MFKKGSLEIGINTIVILVIAMVLLGLGIGFIRNLFQNAGELPELIDTDQLGNQPTSSDPILLSPSEIEVKRGDSKEVKVGVYNNKQTDYTFAIDISQCVGPASVVPEVQSLTAQVPAGESRGYKVIVSAQEMSTGQLDDMQAGKYICNMQAVAVEPTSINNPGGPIPIANNPFTYDTQFIMTVVT